MTTTEFWFWIWIAIIGGVTLCSVANSVRRCFYHKYDAPHEYSKEGIELAKINRVQSDDYYL